MTGRALGILARPVGVIVGVLVVFFLLDDTFRHFEATTSAWVLHTLGVADEAVVFVPGSSIAVFPQTAGPFLATVTSSCSSLSSLLAVAFLGLFTPRRAPVRRAGALLAACVVILAGNVARIAASLGIGLAAGPASLVLFHDWVGSLSAFAYTVGGYLLMLWILLPRNDEGGSDALQAVSSNRSGVGVV